MKVTLTCVVFSLALIGIVDEGGAAECGHNPANIRVTDHFYYTASSDQGAVGDVVGIELSLTMDRPDPGVDGEPRGLYSFDMTLCYDGTGLELLENISYSEYFDQFAFLPHHFADGGYGSPTEGDTLGRFELGGTLVRDAETQVLRPGEPFPMCVIYFRIRGEVGASYFVEFCDDVLVHLNCGANSLWYSLSVPPYSDIEARSTRHIPGLVHVLPGEPTRPEPPPTPPNAKVYPEPPTAERANIRFELDGPAFTFPGATDVPFRLYATSNYEFSGFMCSVAFPPEHLELRAVDEPTRPGTVAIDNAGGSFGIITAGTRRRIGAEGERVHLATLHFKVKEAASEASSLVLAIERRGNYFNWLEIHHQDGVNAEQLPVASEVTPVFVGQALLGVKGPSTPRGDVNFDAQVNLSDAVALLSHLFLGGRADCLAAADFNLDQAVNISDPIAILGFLFLGAVGPAGSVECD